MTRRVLILVALTGLLSLGSVAPAVADDGNKAGDTLVNVQISDVTVQVPISVAANLCDIDVNILSAQASQGNTTCTATAESVAISLPDSGGKSGTGDGNEAGDSLVNLQIDDVTLQVPISVAANICDVSVNVLSLQLETGTTTCTASASSTAGSQPPKG
jgi:hypothetical protein